MPQALYRKWRPQRWDDVVGQEHVVTTLRNAVASGRTAHAYLFSGPRGTGKTTSARLLAKAVNCLHDDPAERPCDDCDHCRLLRTGRFLDLIEIDAASNTSVDDVRDLRDKINFSPNQGRYKVYIIDEVHMLSTAAFNALLKTLEEPPPHAVFILATTEVHKIPATVASRCQKHEFRRIGAFEIAGHLDKIVAAEGIEIEPEALQLIARQATGAMRDAISLLDQLASGGEAITHARAQDILGTATSQAVLELVEALVAGEPGGGLDLIHRALDAGTDPRQFARQVVEYLRDLLLLRMGSKLPLDASKEVRSRMAAQAGEFAVPALLHAIQAFNAAAGELRSSWQPALPLELALVEAINPPAAPVEGPIQVEKKVSREADPEPVRKRDLKGLPEAPAKAAPVGGAEIDQLRAHWKEIRVAVRRLNSATDGLLNSSAVLEIRGSELFLGFASETVKGIMESENHIDFAQRGIEQVFGRKLAIRCVIASDAADIPDDLTSDGMVATAMRLGGKIVHSRERKDRKN
ncbi:MAG TPA: DNA polymerase III subunit gamma/tau [Anaerolineales bacterium]|nr:DNA polymerase III subunit gamma/tau [Anaerolineales bacterium]